MNPDHMPRNAVRDEPTKTPCPECETTSHLITMRHPDESIFVLCNRCGLRTRPGDTIEEAIYNWNERAEMPKERESKVPEWDGESWLPPVGCKCEALSETGWIPVTIIAHHKGWAIFTTEAQGHDMFRWSKYPQSFRPLRTAEQRAEDEAVEEMRKVCPYPGSKCTAIDCRALYRAGYRKQAEGEQP